MPELLIIAGPNGAGKTTAAHVLLPEVLPGKRYINADYIAAGMNPLQPELSAIAAGRVMLMEIHKALQNKEDFAFETKLSTRSFIRLIKAAKKAGYRVNIVYLWLVSPKLAVERVKQRVIEGGHDVPQPIIRRRYERSRQNFFSLYQPIVHSWIVYDNSGATPVAVARGNGKIEIMHEELWAKLKK